MIEEFRLQLSIPAQWERIDSVREAVGLSIGAVFGDQALKDAIAMVSAELLENAVKYGETEGGSVRLSIERTRDRIEIRVTNPIPAASTHARALRDRLARVRVRVAR